MKTLLVVAAHPDFSEAIRAGVPADQYRVVHRTGLEEAEPLLVHGLADVGILDVELANVQGIWAFENFVDELPSVRSLFIPLAPGNGKRKPTCKARRMC